MESQLERYCYGRHVQIKCKFGAPDNPEFKGATGWTCTLIYRRRHLTVPFYCGEAWKGNPPTVADVLPCLLSDATGYDNAANFEEWCDEYGYDTDSRRAETVYKSCGKLSVKLHRFLGDEFDDFASKEH